MMKLGAVTMAIVRNVFLVLGAWILQANWVCAFESTGVLPEGVRGVSIRTVDTKISQKTDTSGKALPLGHPLMQDVSFRRLVNNEQGIKATQLEAFLTDAGFNLEDSVGQFTADLKGHLQVTAPIFSYGITDRVTIAVAVPFYRAQTSVQVGFRENENAHALVQALALTENNNTASAQEAATKLNNAVSRLNNKLALNGYRELKDWQAEGLGDVTLAAKYRFFNRPHLAMASTTGVVAPTGRVDDPEILNDVGFGDGQWDLFTQMTFDQPLGFGLLVNEYAKYTTQLPDNKKIRSQTDDELIEVGSEQTRFKLGDKVDAGASLQFQPSLGIVAGLGYVYFRKFGDLYEDLAAPVQSKLESGTDQVSHSGAARLGYSSVPAFRRGELGVPFELQLTYQKQFSSKNLPVTDLTQVDVNLYF